MWQQRGILSAHALNFLEQKNPDAILIHERAMAGLFG